MPLNIKHNRAEHTHENEQFRRVASSLKLLFKQQNWDGLLLGNPFNETYSRFRPDAILVYNHGLMIIDFKAYAGTIELPPNKQAFESMAWYTETEDDKRRTLIKAGNRFINPFKQLHSYREAFKEIVDNELALQELVKKSRTCALNIFSGPITVKNEIPKKLPFYKLTQESDLGSLLYDYSSENVYSIEIEEALTSIFNAREWQEHIAMPLAKTHTERMIEIEYDVEQAISEFLKIDTSGILVLESINTQDRDDWIQYILSESHEFEIPQTETWIHSARTGKKISMRLGIELQSLYNTIYGGAPKTLNIEKQLEEDEKQFEEQLQEIVPIRSDESVDESAVIILHEAHLVSRSLHQSELLRFGSGRLLEDLIQFLNLGETKRKLICVGDPYSLSYGKDTDSAINLASLAELFDGNINHYRNPVQAVQATGKLGTRLNLASSIEHKMFNNLDYQWAKNDLEEIQKDDIPNYLAEWFSIPFESEPTSVVMVYSNKDARKINLWIKTNCLKNGNVLAPNDLLLVNNNINIPDDSGFGQPTKLFNGMYLLVKSVGETITKPIPIRQSRTPILLNFTKINVKCLSLPNRLEAEIWILDNYFESENRLSKEEQIAFRVFVNMLVTEKSKAQPFEDSYEYMQLQQDRDYKIVLDEEKQLKVQLEAGQKVKTKLDKQQREIRNIERKYKKLFRNHILSNISKTDSLVNAIQASHGWALTVHKCIGSTFTNSIINAYQGENRGITNAEYYRWLYSGVTTTSGTLRIANPQTVHPLMETHFEDTSLVNQGVEAPKRKFLAFTDYQVGERFSAKIPASLNDNVKGSIGELTKILEPNGFLLETAIPRGDYLTKVKYSIPESTEKHLILAIHNKGTKDGWVVSSIRLEKSSGSNESVVNESIEKLFKSQAEQSSNHFELPSDFRLPIYQKWQKKLEEHGYIFSLVESHNSQDVIAVRNSTGVRAKFRVWYRNDGFISKFIMLEKSDDQISENLKKWLLNGI